MKGQSLRTVIVSLNSLTAVHAVLKKITTQDVTAAETGVADEAALKDLTLMGDPVVRFDGFFYTVFIFCTQG